jgi:uncharacterized protein YbcI
VGSDETARGDEVTPQSVRDEIAREILRVHSEAYGDAPRDAKVFVIDDIALVLIDAEPTRSESTLIDAGRGDAVQATREAFQEAIAPTFTAIIERATGRKVNSFSSRMSMEPMYAVEFFRLEPGTS